MEDTTVIVSLCVCSLIAIVTKYLSKLSKVFRLQRQFFSVYLLALFSDWLKGAYVYALYSSYGFASSAVFGTFTGPLTDRLGRRRMSLAFTLVYSMSALCKIWPNYFMLMMGRLLGGVATSLLCSTFESWYVHQHLHHHKFPSTWLSSTFSLSTFYNGLLAIMAGLLSNLLAESLKLGPLAPFLSAVPVLGLCAVLISLTWQENYGEIDARIGGGGGELHQAHNQGLLAVLSQRGVLVLGLIQTCAESSMYIFVFLWTPVLLNNPTKLPLGLIFSTFMVCIMIGSQVSAWLYQTGLSHLSILRRCLVVMTVSLGVASISSRTSVTTAFFSFLAFELAIGCYFPAISSLRSEVIPEQCRAAVLSWYRLPLNLVTCLTLASLTLAVEKETLLMVAAHLSLQGVLLTFSPSSDQNRQKTVVL